MPTESVSATETASDGDRLQVSQDDSGSQTQPRLEELRHGIRLSGDPQSGTVTQTGGGSSGSFAQTEYRC